MTGPDHDEATRAAARELLRDLVRGLGGDRPAPTPVDGHGADRPATNGHAGSGHAGGGRRGEAHGTPIVPQVPAPPVAAVLRPSTWSAPAAPGEVIGERPTGSAHAAPDLPSRASRSGPHTPPPSCNGVGSRAASPAFLAPDVRVEAVTLDGEEDLQQFVRALAARMERPRDRLAIRTGRLRFALHRRPGTARDAPPDPGANREKVVRVEKGAVTERAVREAATAGMRLVLARGAVLTPLARDRAVALGVDIEREREC